MRIWNIIVDPDANAEDTPRDVRRMVRFYVYLFYMAIAVLFGVPFALVLPVLFPIVPAVGITWTLDLQSFGLGCLLVVWPAALIAVEIHLRIIQKYPLTLEDC